MEVIKIFDIEKLIELWEAYLAKSNQIDNNKLMVIRRQLTTYFSKMLEEKRLVAIGISEDNAVVSGGFLIIDERPASPAFLNGLIGVVMNVYTDPAHRGKGYASIVMKTIIEQAQQLGLSVLDLSATEAGKNVYLKLGFKESKYTSMRLVL